MNFEQKADLCLGGSISKRKELFTPLLNVGRELANKNAKDPKTFIVNVPRIEYAAVLIALGVIIEWSCISEDGEWEKEVTRWVGKKVSFRPKGTVNPGTVWTAFLVRLGNGSESEVIFKDDINGEYALKYNEIESIRLDESEKKKIVRSGISKNIKKKLSKILGEEGISNLNSNLGKIGLLGTKNRIQDELSETISAQSENDCTFLEILKPDNPEGESERTSLYSGVGDINSAPEEIMIIEGSRQISELIDQTKQSNRVFILASNEIFYENACTAIKNSFRGLDKTFLSNGFITIFNY